jgi:hypothetical protein
MNKKPVLNYLQRKIDDTFNVPDDPCDPHPKRYEWHGESLTLFEIWYDGRRSGLQDAKYFVKRSN